MKIGLITPDAGDACSTYRGVGPYMKIDCELNIYDGKKGFYLWDAITRNDLLVLQRPHTSQASQLARAIKAFGRPLIVDWDDDLSDVPPWNPFKVHFKDSLPVLHDCARLADAVTVTTPALAKKATEWGARRVWIIPNAIDDSLMHGLAFPRKRTKVIAWRGSDTHSADLELCKPTILEYCEKGYMAAFFGACPPWAYQIHHKHFPVADACVYLANLAALAPEYFIYYLADHPFNHCKSDIAAQEAYAIGAKLLHNGIGAYAGLFPLSEPRLLSQTNKLRIDLIKEII